MCRVCFIHFLLLFTCIFLIAVLFICEIEIEKEAKSESRRQIIDTSMAKELEFYNSFDDVSAECLFCRDNIDDPIRLGKKLSSDGITAHHYCLVRMRFE